MAREFSFETLEPVPRATRSASRKPAAERAAELAFGPHVGIRVSIELDNEGECGYASPGVVVEVRGKAVYVELPVHGADEANPVNRTCMVFTQDEWGRHPQLDKGKNLMPLDVRPFWLEKPTGGAWGFESPVGFRALFEDKDRSGASRHTAGTFHAWRPCPNPYAPDDNPLAKAGVFRLLHEDGETTRHFHAEAWRMIRHYQAEYFHSPRVDPWAARTAGLSRQPVRIHAEGNHEARSWFDGYWDDFAAVHGPEVTFVHRNGQCFGQPMHPQDGLASVTVCHADERAKPLPPGTVVLSEWSRATGTGGLSEPGCVVGVMVVWGTVKASVYHNYSKRNDVEFQMKPDYYDPVAAGAAESSTSTLRSCGHEPDAGVWRRFRFAQHNTGFDDVDTAKQLEQDRMPVLLSNMFWVVPSARNAFHLSKVAPELYSKLTGGNTSRGATKFVRQTSDIRALFELLLVHGPRNQVSVGFWRLHLSSSGPCT